MKKKSNKAPQINRDAPLQYTGRRNHKKKKEDNDCPPLSRKPESNRRPFHYE